MSESFRAVFSSVFVVCGEKTPTSWHLCGFSMCSSCVCCENTHIWGMDLNNCACVHSKKNYSHVTRG